MRDFRINNIGLDELKKRRRENRKLFFILPVFFLLYMFLTYISMRGSTFFWAILPFFFIIYVLFGIYAPIVAAKRFNKVVTKLTFNKADILLKTDKVNFTKEKEIIVNNPELRIIESTNILYGSGRASGIILKINPNKEFYIIKKFFSDFDNIKSQFENFE